MSVCNEGTEEAAQSTMRVKWSQKWLLTSFYWANYSPSWSTRLVIKHTCLVTGPSLKDVQPGQRSPLENFCPSPTPTHLFSPITHYSSNQQTLQPIRAQRTGLVFQTQSFDHPVSKAWKTSSLKYKKPIHRPPPKAELNKYSLGLAIALA